MRAATALAVGVVAIGVLGQPAASAAHRPDSVKEGLNSLVRQDGVPAALASVKDDKGHTRTYTAGVGDLATGAKVPKDGQVRIGSNTKTFTSVVVLQLVDEGKVRLDAPIEDYLPGLVRGEGIDGHNITIRHLLQHTSGLPNYVKYLDPEPRSYTPRELLDRALQHKKDFDPGKKWEYSNTNYVLAGLLIEKVTKHSVAHEIGRRVIKPLGLRHTYFPAPGETKIREAHPKGYDKDASGAPLDVTEFDPSWGWSAGQMVSTNSDLNRFAAAILDGSLLSDAQLAQMRTTVSAEYFGPGARYGLGLVSKPLSCGGVYWGHGGSMTGYETRGGATEDGRAANVAVTTQPSDANVMKHVDRVVDKALCAS
ncbi:class A beta-lactamase-related serine hydrolase [Streptomyces kanamyceticus]|uniref:Class A beta-lactamase-related serine hydrolase n=1 Tax=Streptomyces kanamyceticus TaxID=1967 RepID=A0A5J6GSU1_STRKN|nr:serine hydrolase domain-containing protein [Streptomyces kanamyceticus]QEU97434.1 class A beta-lactamase-related serine hydrolase [Streptomyces kanamyceticus]